MDRLNTEKYILYILNHLPPGKSTLFYLNKIAFLVEFSYRYFNEKDLSTAHYAAITYGPVIDDYELILKSMQKKGLIKIQGNNIRVVTTEEVKLPREVDAFAMPLIQKYSSLSWPELKAITHDMDSYKITTDNEKFRGRRIDKDLASLETFFDNGQNSDEPTKLPSFDRKNLVDYEFGSNIQN
ncbi:MAG: DUF4065 domain-containing protein [Candidatus Sungbacteria bacterium]|uniref:DUF4065 domain-containing protein n=1 Tax=Candidatus Sungiibacteriota bacterium TaxID=2750080 RepID=A0A9D6LTA0_9BACT|nr:DUF4065 domain-containing protein [Candidatus Sungbacteria bacterium]